MQEEGITLHWNGLQAIYGNSSAWKHQNLPWNHRHSYLCSTCVHRARTFARLYKGRLFSPPAHLASRTALHELFDMASSPGANSTALPGFAPITETNKAGILWIASLLSGIYAVLAILVRWYQKRKCFGIDDWICLAATVRLSALDSVMMILTSDRLWAWAPSSPFTLRFPKAWANPPNCSARLLCKTSERYGLLQCAAARKLSH